MFESRKDLTERNAALEADLKEAEEALSSATADTDNLRDTLAQLTQDLEAERSALAEVRQEKEDINAVLTTATESLTEAHSRLETFDAEVAAAAKAKSAAHLERLGHPVVDIENPAQDENVEPVDHMAEWGAIDDPKEAFIYFQQHKDAIRAARFNKN